MSIARPRLFALLTALAALCCAPLRLAADEAPAAPRPLMLGQTVDFLDNCFFACAPDEDYYTPQQLRRHVQEAYDAGFRRIYFRGTGGIAYYPSKWRRLYNGSHREDWARRLHKTVRAYDTVREYLNVCHELGMELYYWEPIFDAGDVIRNYPGTKAFEEWGEWANRDTSIKNEHCMAHRFAARPVERPAGPIAKIELYPNNEPVYEEGAFDIYVADHGDARFVRYEKPFQVEVRPGGPEGARTTVVVSGLAIDKPIVKFQGRKGNGWVVGTPTSERRAAQAFYADGTPVDIFTSCEVTEFCHYAQDANLGEQCLEGFAKLYGRAWGNTGESFIMRIGDFKRFIPGMPDYAFMENRERIRNIVTELYERYPDLDGVTFSIRTHHCPAGGVRREVQPQGLAYGYAAPVVEEFKRRHGVDVLTQDFDLDKFQALRGEYFTRLLGEVAPIVHSHGGKLECMAPVRKPLPYAHGTEYNWWDGLADIDNFFDIAAWARKGYVDTVIMLGSGYKQKGPLTQEIKDEIDAFHRKLEGTSVRLAFHYLITDALKDDETRQFFAELVAHPLLDGVECYEGNGMIRVDNYGDCRKIVDECPRPVAK